MANDLPNNGGPAYPTQYAHGPEQNGVEPGMTLRDWFAGQALVGILTAAPHQTFQWNGDQDMADAAYAIADAMLIVRAEGR